MITCGRGVLWRPLGRLYLQQGGPILGGGVEGGGGVGLLRGRHGVVGPIVEIDQNLLNPTGSLLLWNDGFGLEKIKLTVVDFNFLKKGIFFSKNGSQETQIS